MSKYQAYPEYKDSGVEWLGGIPKHWRCTQVKYGYDVTLGKMLQKAKSSCLDELRPYLKAQNIQPNGVDLNNVDMMWFSPEERKKLLLKPQDVLVSEGGDVGRSAIWREQLPECYIQNAINRVRASNGNSSTFFYYWLSYLKFVDFISILCNKATIAHYTAEKLESSPLILPSIEEQNQIVLFLDHETAKIDALIEKQQQLIELLKEKRQAVISHAVTKGLNPDVTMKDSGVEWLGEMPTSWGLSFVKYIVLEQKDSMVDGPFGSSVNTDVDYVESGVPVIRTVNITNAGFSAENLKFMRRAKYQQLKRHSVKPGDVLFSKVGTIGNSCILPESIPEAILSTTGSCKISVNHRKIVPDYFVYLIHSMNQELMQIANSNVQPFLNMSNIKNLRIPLPCISEQVCILKYLNEKLFNIDEVLNDSIRLECLLQEHRTALISAAVTGKIDVRNWVAPTNDTEVNQELQEATA